MERDLDGSCDIHNAQSDRKVRADPAEISTPAPSLC